MTATVDSFIGLHTERPSIYLDQWVWIRLAKVAAGRPTNPADVDVLDAVRRAAEAGVAFPLSSTHYFETLQIKDPRQRESLAAVMAPVSRLLNLRAQRPLMRHQLLQAMHESFGIPAFRPEPPAVLGLGVQWAMTGEARRPKIMKGDREATTDEVPSLHKLHRAVGQYMETKLLTGPEDDEIPRLRELGYRPKYIAASTGSRLDWEKVYTELLKKNPVDRGEMRVHLIARELIHEHFDLWQSLMADYHLDLYRLMRFDPEVPGSMRADMMRFSDRIPTMRIAAEMKIEQFRNAARPWTVNMMRDIDAISRACRIAMSL